METPQKSHIKAAKRIIKNLREYFIYIDASTLVDYTGSDWEGYMKCAKSNLGMFLVLIWVLCLNIKKQVMALSTVQ